MAEYIDFEEVKEDGVSREIRTGIALFKKQDAEKDAELKILNDRLSELKKLKFRLMPEVNYELWIKDAKPVIAEIYAEKDKSAAYVFFNTFLFSEKYRVGHVRAISSVVDECIEFVESKISRTVFQDFTENKRVRNIIEKYDPNDGRLKSQPKYNHIHAEYFLSEITSTTDSLKEICERTGVSVKVICYWLSSNDDFYKKFLDCKKIQAFLFVDSALEAASEEVGDSVASSNQKRQLSEMLFKISASLNKEVFGKETKIKMDVNETIKLDTEAFERVFEKLTTMSKAEDIHEDEMPDLDNIMDLDFEDMDI